MAKSKKKESEKNMVDIKFTVFPDWENSILDMRLSEMARKIIVDAVETLDKPFMLTMSEYLGMKRARLSRMMSTLGIRDWYDQRKVEKLAVANWEEGKEGRQKPKMKKKR